MNRPDETDPTGHDPQSDPARAGSDVVVRGATVDDQTRCAHYASPLDVVAIRFRCCGEYYPCHLCHEEAAGHPAERWPASEFDARAVLCGVCRHELTIAEYQAATACPHCGARFNPRCASHSHLYFDIPALFRAK